VRSKPNTKTNTFSLNGAWNSFFVNVGEKKTSFSLSLKFPLIIVGTAIIICKRVIHYGSNFLTQI